MRKKEGGGREELRKEERVQGEQKSGREGFLLSDKWPSSTPVKAHPSASRVYKDLLIQGEILAAHWATSLKRILPSAFTVITMAL